MTATTQISASMVKELREKTGAGMLDAKNALTEAQGDMDKAMELLRQKGVASAEKKSGRAAAEGLVQANLSKDGKSGILIEVNCETDFVARGEAFVSLVNELADQALASKTNTTEELLAEKSAANKSVTVAEYLKEMVGSLKENIQLRRYVHFNVAKEGLVHAYIHTGGKIGVLVELSAGNAKAAKTEEFKQLAKDIAMHVASAAPEYLTRTEIPADVLEEEKRIEMGKEDLQKKPAEIREKIVIGRVDKLMAQRVLLEQPFVKDPAKTIQELLADVSKSAGAPVELVRFVRFLLGEGVEKRQENFAEEVMAQIKG